MVLAFIRDLQRLGIKANLRVLDTSAFQGRLNDYDFDMVSYFWRNSLSPGTEQMLYWSCESANIKSRWNYPGICNPAIDSFAGAIANAKDYDELTTYAHALDRTIMWGEYMIPLYYIGQDYIASSINIAHPEEMPLYGAVLETWWIEQNEGVSKIEQ